jgi:outer membrane lipoprotein-sorting protein
MLRTRTTLALAAGLILLPALVAAQENFEGTVKYKMNAGGMSMDMVTKVKDGRMRQEISMPMGAMVSIINTETGEMLNLMDAQKMAMRMNMNDMMAMAGVDRSEAAEVPEMKATGHKETIAGHACEHYVIQQDDGDIDMCVATGLGYYMNAARGPMMGAGRGGRASNSMGMSDKQREALRRQFKNGFFPLKMVVTPKSGGEAVTMEVVSFEKGNVPDSMFDMKTPEGYTEMKMPGGMGRN